MTRMTDARGPSRVRVRDRRRVPVFDAPGGSGSLRLSGVRTPVRRAGRRDGPGSVRLHVRGVSVGDVRVRRARAAVAGVPVRGSDRADRAEVPRRRRRAGVSGRGRQGHHRQAARLGPGVRAVRVGRVAVLSLPAAAVHVCLLRAVCRGAVPLSRRRPRTGQALGAAARHARLGQHARRFRGRPRGHRPRDRDTRVAAAAGETTLGRAGRLRRRHLREPDGRAALGLCHHGAHARHEPAVHRRVGPGEPRHRRVVGHRAHAHRRHAARRCVVRVQGRAGGRAHASGSSGR